MEIANRQICHAFVNLDWLNKKNDTSLGIDTDFADELIYKQKKQKTVSDESFKSNVYRFGEWVDLVIQTVRNVQMI